MMKNNKGIVLVLVLMVVAIITAMVVEFAYGVYVSTSALHNSESSQRLSLAARSATQLGARLIAEKAALKPYTPPPGIVELSQKIPFEEIEGTITIRIEDETARFNVNALVNANGTLNDAAYKSFVRLLKALDLRTEIADRIVDWIDKDNIPRLADSEQGAKNDYLDSLDEILSVPGIGKEAFERLQPYVTIYGNRLVDINTAGFPVIMSLSDAIDRRMAEDLIRYREITPFEKIQDILKVAGFETVGMPIQGYISFKSSTFRVIATATSGDVKRIIESVMDIAGTTRTVRYWREY